MVSQPHLLGQNLMVGSHVRGVSLPPDGQEEKRYRQGPGKIELSRTCLQHLASSSWTQPPEVPRIPQNIITS